MDINFIVYNQENQPVGMNVDELFEGADPNAEKVALAVVKATYKNAYNFFCNL